MYAIVKTFLILLIIPFSTFAQSGAVSVFTYGAIGNNGLDEGTKIQTALNSGYGRVELEAGKTYFSSVQLKVPNGVTFYGNGATVKPYSTLPYNNTFFITTPTATTHNATGQSISVTEGSSAFTYSGASNLTPGELVLLQNTATPYYSPSPTEPYYYGWYAVVLSVIGTTVTLDRPAPASFTANVVKEFKTGKNIHIKNMVVDMAGRTDGFGVELANCTNSSIEDVTLKGNVPTRSNSITIGIQAQGVNIDVLRCRSYGIRSVIPGYAFAATGHNINFRYCNAWASRCAFSSAGRNYISTQINYLYDTATGTDGGGGPLWDWHANAAHSRMEGCYGTIGGPQTAGVQVRGPYDTVQNNTLVMQNAGTTLYATAIFENPSYCLIQNNTLSVSGGGSNKAIGTFNINYIPPVNVSFINNVISTATIAITAPMGTGLNTSGNTVDGGGVYNPPPPPPPGGVDTTSPKPPVECECWKLVHLQ